MTCNFTEEKQLVRVSYIFASQHNIHTFDNEALAAQLCDWLAINEIPFAKFYGVPCVTERGSLVTNWFEHPRR